MFIDLRQRKQERETLMCDRTPVSCLPYMPWLEIEPTTQVCALTGNQTCNLLVYGMTLQPAEPPGQGDTRLSFCQEP